MDITYGRCKARRRSRKSASGKTFASATCISLTLLVIGLLGQVHRFYREGINNGARGLNHTGGGSTNASFISAPNGTNNGNSVKVKCEAAPIASTDTDISGKTHLNVTPATSSLSVATKAIPVVNIENTTAVTTSQENVKAKIPVGPSETTERKVSGRVETNTSAAQ